MLLNRPLSCVDYARWNRAGVIFLPTDPRRQGASHHQTRIPFLLALLCPSLCSSQMPSNSSCTCHAGGATQAGMGRRMGYAAKWVLVRCAGSGWARQAGHPPLSIRAKDVTAALKRAGLPCLPVAALVSDRAGRVSRCWFVAVQAGSLTEHRHGCLTALRLQSTVRADDQPLSYPFHTCTPAPPPAWQTGRAQTSAAGWGPRARPPCAPPAACAPAAASPRLPAGE